MSLKVKRLLALFFCCALLAAAIYQNVRSGNADEVAEPDDTLTEDVIFVQDYNSEETGESDGDSVATGVLCGDPVGYIAGLRIEREAERSAYTEECLAVIENVSSAESDILQAQDDILSVNSVIESEKTLETMLKGRGYEDVFVEYNDDGYVDIVLVAKNITESEIDMITTAVNAEVEVTSEYITVRSVY